MLVCAVVASGLNGDNEMVYFSCFKEQHESNLTSTITNYIFPGVVK